MKTSEVALSKQPDGRERVAWLCAEVKK